MKIILGEPDLIRWVIDWGIGPFLKKEIPSEREREKETLLLALKKQMICWGTGHMTRTWGWPLGAKGVPRQQPARRWGSHSQKELNSAISTMNLKTFSSLVKPLDENAAQPTPWSQTCENPKREPSWADPVGLTHSDPDLQNCEIINGCWLESLSLWSFVMQP